jgi:hypothetical protein
MQNVQYGNWVPEKILALYWIISVLTGVLCITGYFSGWQILIVLFTVILCIIALASAVYMQLCHHIFSPWMLSGLGLLYGRK